MAQRATVSRGCSASSGESSSQESPSAGSRSSSNREEIVGTVDATAQPAIAAAAPADERELPYWPKSSTFGAVKHKQEPLLDIQATFDQIGQQR